MVEAMPGVQVTQKPNSLEVGQIAILKVPVLPGIRMTWTAEHTVYRKNEEFADIQKKGPFTYFYHRHIFYPDTDKNSDASILEDRIELEAPFSWISNFFVGFILKKQFLKRHRITASALNIGFTPLENGIVKYNL